MTTATLFRSYTDSTLQLYFAANWSVVAVRGYAQRLGLIGSGWLLDSASVKRCDEVPEFAVVEAV